MASPDGRDGPALSGVLADEPYRFDIRQAVRLTERVAQVKRVQPGCVPLGTGSDPRREAVRLRSSLTSRFPPSDIESFAPAGADERPTLTVTFLGLGGAFGPLPPPLSARIVERVRLRDHAGRDFLDVFNHRLLSLFLRQSRLLHPALHAARDTDAPARMPALAMLGVATLPRDGSSASVEGRLGGLATSLLAAAGLLGRRPLSAHALQRLLAAHFGLPVRVVPLCGGWLSLADAQRTRLGQSGRLGDSALLGRRVWDQAAGICIEIGPVGRDQAVSLLPGRAAHADLARLAEFALGEVFDVDLRLLLRAEDVPQAAIGTAGSRLGWTSWLGRRPRRTPGSLRLHLRRPGTDA